MKNPRMPRPPLNRIGHNSVQLPHDGKLDRHSYNRMMDRAAAHDRELSWRRFEREQARRERFVRIKKGMIIPPHHIPPQLMVKKDGVWVPEIKTC